MAGIIEKKALETADSIASECGCAVIGAEYKKEGGERYLRIYIDKPGGIGIDECESFSRKFDEVFDKLELIDEAYILEISSPGADRVLKTEREFTYYKGRKVEAKLYKAIEGKKEFCGTLGDFDGETAQIDVDGETVKVPVKDAVYIRLYFEF